MAKSGMAQSGLVGTRLPPCAHDSRGHFVARAPSAASSVAPAYPSALWFLLRLCCRRPLRWPTAPNTPRATASQRPQCAGGKYRAGRVVDDTINSGPAEWWTIQGRPSGGPRGRGPQQRRPDARPRASAMPTTCPRFVARIRFASARAAALLAPLTSPQVP